MFTAASIVSYAAISRRTVLRVPPARLPSTRAWSFRTSTGCVALQMSSAIISCDAFRAQAFAWSRSRAISLRLTALSPLPSCYGQETGLDRIARTSSRGPKRVLIPVVVRPHPRDHSGFTDRWRTDNAVTFGDPAMSFDRFLEHYRPRMLLSWYSTTLFDALRRGAVPVTVPLDPWRPMDMVFPFQGISLKWPEDRAEVERLVLRDADQPGPAGPEKRGSDKFRPLPPDERRRSCAPDSRRRDLSTRRTSMRSRRTPRKSSRAGPTKRGGRKCIFRSTANRMRALRRPIRTSTFCAFLLNRLWYLRMALRYQGSFDAIFYPGLHRTADYAALRIRVLTGRTPFPMISTMEEIYRAAPPTTRR